MTRFGKHTNISLEDLIYDAYQHMIKNSSEHGFKLDIDAVFVGSMNVDEFTGEGNLGSVVVDKLDLVPLPAVRVETASATGSGVFQTAALGVSSGIYNNVLIIACEKMTDLPTSRTTSILAKVLSPLERAHGATMPALSALVTRRYMKDHNLSLEDLAKVAVKSHYNGSLNPFAHFQKEVSLETIMESRIIASPLRIYDCSPISDGAAALVLTSRKTDVKVTGIGQGTDHLSLQTRSSLTSFGATRTAAKKAFEMAGRSPPEIDIAEVHDAFTPFEIIGTEDLGFFDAGEGGQAVIDGRTDLNGDIPINTSGGHKARGHPVGASGLAQVIEIVWQLRGECEKRQVDNVKIGLTQNIGGFASNNFVNILEVFQ
jgi:acetyl-CoA acetyltransferase